jgi:predicted DNA-binding transcriptional regulator AlpA
MITPHDPQVTKAAETEPKLRQLVPLDFFLAKACISRSHYYALRKLGKTPKAIKLSPGRRGAIRLVESECDIWIDDLLAARAESNAVTSPVKLVGDHHGD